MGQDLHKALEKEFALYEEKFSELIRGDFSVIDPVSRQIFKSKGKQLRPLLVFLTHKLFKEDVDEQAYLAASLVEIVHAASLVHDDVVDMADMRRGNASVRSLFGNKTAVLAGDYLLANAFLKAYGQSQGGILQSLVEVIKMMSEGELLQLEYAHGTEADEEAYYRIIERKTAALFKCCSRCGALTAGADPQQAGLCEEIGRNLGLAFQIQDDLLDLDTESDNGKNYGNDLKEGKLTLPTLYMLREAASPGGIGSTGKEKFLLDLKRLSEAEEKGEPTDTELLNRLIHQIKRSGGEEYARSQARKFHTEAVQLYRQLGIPSPLFEELMQQITKCRQLS